MVAYQNRIHRPGIDSLGFTLLNSAIEHPHFRQVYPKGTQIAIDEGDDDYMGLYFQLCRGDYDDQLEWPFDQQFVRLSITDQGPNPNTRLNILSNFITSRESLNNASYERPITVIRFLLFHFVGHCIYSMICNLAFTHC